MPTAEQFIAGAWKAVPQFELDAVDVSILSHSENVVCDVTLRDGSRVVMRLHRPGYNTAEELECEVQWVAALRIAGVRVPAAMPAQGGSHYAAVSIGDETRYVGVVDWVHGTPVGEATGAAGESVVKHYADIGGIAAQIRTHSTGWKQPSGFVRRRWDSAGLVGEEALWGRFWALPGLSPAHRDLFSAARTKLIDELGSLSTGSDAFGLIHADLHLGNVMADGDQLTVIDFDDAGYGWFVHELAVALHPVLGEPWEAAARKALVRGYRRLYPLSEREEELIDTFLTVRSLTLVSWLDARRELPTHEYFDNFVTEAVTQSESYLS